MNAITKKLLCVFLCLLFIFTALPTGTFLANAQITNVTSTNEIILSSQTDWIAFAAEGTALEGITVKLGADIDADGELLPTLFSEFSGTFDGQGYTIRNFEATDALISLHATGNVTIQNLTVEDGNVSGTRKSGVGLLFGDFSGAGTLNVQNCSLSASVTAFNELQGGIHVGGIIGSLSLENDASARFEHLNLNLTVENTTEGTDFSWYGTGGIIGIFEPIGRPELTLRSINLEGSVTAGLKTTVGGFIGTVFSADADADLYTGGTIQISNCQTTTSISSSAKPDLGVGGLIGAFGISEKYAGDNCIFDGTLSIDNCLIGGEISQSYLADQVYACGGVIGSLGYGDAKIRVDHSLITTSFPSNALSSSNGRGAGLILGYSCNLTKSSLSINNTVTTITEPHHLINAVGVKSAKNDATAFYPWLTLNGKNLGAQKTEASVFPAFPNDTTRYYIAAVSDHSILSVSEQSAQDMIEKSNDGFLTRIRGQISILGVQDNVADGALLTSDDKYSIRFIALSALDVLPNAKITVIVKDAATQVAFKKYTAHCDAYDVLLAYRDNGELLKSYRASDFSAKKFYALILRNIHAGSGYTFEITPEFTNEDGTTVLGETLSVTYNEHGQYLPTQNWLDVDPLPSLTPTVRVLSSNALAHAAANAGEGGISSSERLQYLADAFLFYEPDFIGMQEMQEQNSVNGRPYNMQTELLSLIGHEYAMVDFSDKVSPKYHWTPMFYRSDRWTPIESNIDTDIVNEMHRWQWAVYQSKENPGVRFIHVNLHLTPARPEEYQEVSREVAALTQKYPDTPIAVSGDYNANLGSDGYHPSTFQALIGSTKLQNAIYLTKDHEAGVSTCSNRTALLDTVCVEEQIDHFMLTSNTAAVKKHRVIRNVPMGQASDHYAVYVDVVYRSEFYSPGSLIDWNFGTVIS